MSGKARTLYDECGSAEYKYRRGGKTLCTFYAKEGTANILITYGKSERETLHDGKWLWIPIDRELRTEDILLMLKIKRRPNRKTDK